jgi:hypothetical protein
MATRQSTLVGVLIVLVSIFGAYVTWRAAGASGTASDLDQRARQAHILQAQIRAENASILSFERRMFAKYVDHLRLARGMQRDGAWRAAQEERAVARSMLPFFASAGFSYDSAGRPRFDSRAATRSMERDPRLADLRPEELDGAADGARTKRLWLVAVDTALIGSIFFLTLALLGSNVRRRLAAAGLAIGISAVVAFAVVTISVEVPAA